MTMDAGGWAQVLPISVATNPFAFLVICVTGWMNRHQQEVIEYLLEEIHVPKDLLGQKPRFNDEQCQRLAVKAKRLGRKVLDRMVFFDEASLHRAVAEFVWDYNQQRNHQGLDNRIIRPESSEFPAHGVIRRRKRLGGLHNHYYRDTA